MAESGATPLGRSWENWHSLWIGWALFSFGLFGWVSFLYAGARARKRPWLLWAAAYAFPWIPLLISGDDRPGFDSFDASMILILCVWPVSSIHAFRIRREYLRRIAERVIREKGGLSATTVSGAETRPAQTAATAQPTSPITPHASPTTSSTPGSPSADQGASSAATNLTDRTEAAEPLDLNSATEESLAALPGIGPILAKRIVEERSSRGGFQSLEDLAATVDLKPHVLQRLPGSLTVLPRSEGSTGRSRGRVVDF